MNLKSLVVVILRLYALYLIFFGLRNLIVTDSIMMLIWFSSLVVPGMLLWLFATLLAKLITRKLPQDISLGSLDTADCYTVTLLMFGLYCVTANLSNLLYWGYYIFKMAASVSNDSWKSGTNFRYILSNLVPFIFGIMLIFNAKAWSSKLMKFHNRSELVND
ncbi:MAG: hypothetical protein L3J71_10320 [Victivallaceae bacterium]|nr:hypothetical protein [Victivallaceae bacterium]